MDRSAPEWQALWDRAVREMAPYGRRPAPYLITTLLHPGKRRRRWWMRHRFAEIARLTRSQPPDQIRADETLEWNVYIEDPNGRQVSIRIVVNTIDQIYNTFPT